MPNDQPAADSAPVPASPPATPTIRFREPRPPPLTLNVPVDHEPKLARDPEGKDVLPDLPVSPRRRRVRRATGACSALLAGGGGG
ncbi:hypothetical protein CALVIDRAFT_533429 [Calocera viscosa TUFC12733]|uniref:Uncharacterized protein n=1 Tax=Calocera viscosa (strain TUFC12733) TaxID=1330018 RepID=A0A167QZR4_CALVF|nr:hypothetical protein CALVIDRAFT_533429 [Calocera viscosa TUFC12733]